MTMRRVWRGVVVAAAFMTCFEIVCTALAFANMRYRRHVPSAVAAKRLFLTRPVALRVMPPDPRVAMYTGGKQRFLGELSYDSPEWIEMAPPDALLGTRNGRNITALYDESIYVTNDEGFASIGERDFHYSPVRPADCRRIIVVGGSAVFGWGAGTPDRNLPARLSHALERNRSRCFQIINAGVPGYTSAEEFLFVASELVHYHPDLLIVYDGWNDQAQSAGTGSVADINSLKSATHRTIEDRVRTSYSVTGSAHLALLNLSGRLAPSIRRTGSYWAATRVMLRFRDDSHPQVTPRYDAAAMARYRSNLAGMILLTTAHGIDFASFLQPIKWIDGRESIGEEVVTAADAAYADARRAFYTDAREMFAGLAAQYGRAGSVCVEDISRSVKDVAGNIYVDSGHLSGAGNDVVAGEIVDRLARCGVLHE